MLGGLPLSHLSEIADIPTSGATSLAYYILAAAQRSGYHSVVVSLSQGFDGATAARFEVQVYELVLVEVAEMRDLLAVLREILRSGVVGLVLVDLLPLVWRQLTLQCML